MAKPDPKLIEMADVFHIPMKERLKYIILPARLGGRRGREQNKAPGTEQSERQSR